MKSAIIYTLPEELVAQYPARERESARMMVLKRESSLIEEGTFRDITEYFRKGDVLLLNDSLVIPARLRGRKASGGKVEVFLLKKTGPMKWSVLLRGNVREGHVCRITKHGREEPYLEVRINEKKEDGSYEAEFDTDKDEEILGFGDVPLPPYIKRETEMDDEVYYQTVYGRKKGSVAAHTAGLHFTRPLLEEIGRKGVRILYLTLHIGWSSFKILKTDEGKVGEEFYEISEETASAVNDARSGGKRVFAAGTGTVRALESSLEKGIVRPGSGYTGLFIKPGFRFGAVDAMITNFHLPGSTHLYLVCGFAGTGLVEKAYRLAVEKRYRFYSYGDAMLIV